MPTTRKVSKLIMNYLREEWLIGYYPNLLKVVRYFQASYDIAQTKILQAISCLVIKGEVEYERVYEMSERGVFRLFGHNQPLYALLGAKNPEKLSDNKNFPSETDINPSYDITTKDLLKMECDVLNYLNEAWEMGYYPSLERIIHDFRLSSKKDVVIMLSILVNLLKSNDIKIIQTYGEVLRIEEYHILNPNIIDYQWIINEFLKLFITEDAKFCWD